MDKPITTRMGDGERISMPESEVLAEIREGTRDAARRGKIPELPEEDLDALFEIIREPGRIVSVRPGEEIIVTDDGASELLQGSEADGGCGLLMGRASLLLGYERGFAADTACMGYEDFSFKPVKAAIEHETEHYASMSLQTTIPLLYGAQPNMGLYYQPDGPFPNPAELMPAGKIDEARKAQEEAMAQLEDDMVYVAERLYEAGCEAVNVDTAGSAGDADFYASLKAIERMKELFPAMYVELGMSSEFVLGMHGKILYNGERLAGMYPHKQVKAAEAAGADIFGPAINVNCSMSIPWNLSRAVTFVKEVTGTAKIPVHPNVGMGVCGIPMFVENPIDCVTRASKALVQIGKADGL